MKQLVYCALTLLGASFVRAVDSDTTMEMITSYADSNEEAKRQIEALRPGDLGIGPVCYARITAIDPTVSVGKQLCICIFVCLGEDSHLYRTRTPKEDEDLNNYFERQLIDYKKLYQSDRIAFLVGYLVIMVIGVAGNALVLVTLAVAMQQSSATNIFIGSLASADLLVCCVNIPIRINHIYAVVWKAGTVACHVSYYVFYACLIVSVLTLTAMSVERWIAICHPMKAQYLSTTSRARRIVVALWLLGFALAVPVHFVLIIDNEEEICRLVTGMLLKAHAFSVYVFGLLFVVPVLVMSVSYGRVSVALYRSIQTSKAMQSTSEKDKDKGQNDAQGRVKVIRMLIGVLLVFIICWFPLLINEVLYAFSVKVFPGLTGTQAAHINRVLKLLTFVNSCANPILYACLSTQFRRGFVRCFLICCRREQAGKGFPRSVSSGYTSSTGMSRGVSQAISTTEPKPIKSVAGQA